MESLNHSLDTTVQCGICYHSYDEGKKVPRILHDTGLARKHVMCTECILSYRKGKKSFECPECRSVVTYPPEDLPVYTGEGHGLSITTVKVLLNTVMENKSEKCTECDDPATFICFNCETYLCDDCQKTHKKQKKTKEHEVKGLASLTVAQKGKFQPVSLCEKHSEPKDMYCSKCQEACCRKCDLHLQHGFKPLRQALEEEEEFVKSRTKTVSEFKQRLEEDIERLAEKRSNIQFVQTESLTQIENLTSSICDKIKSEGHQLDEELRRENEDVLGNIDRDMAKRKDILETMKLVDLCFTKEDTLPDIKKLELFTVVKEGLASLPAITQELNTETGNEVRRFVEDKNYVSYVSHHSMGYIERPFFSDVSEKGSVTGAIGGIVEIRCLAIGKTKSGRTRTLNALLGADLFLNACTLKGPGIGVWDVSYGDRQFKLSKTPGRNDLDEERATIRKVTLEQGPHVVFLTLKTPETDIDVLDFYETIFGRDLVSHLIIVFTCKKEFDKKRISLKQYMQSTKGRLRDVLTSVDNHYIAVNPDEKNSLPDFQKRMFRMIKNVADSNHGHQLSIQ